MWPIPACLALAVPAFALAQEDAQTSADARFVQPISVIASQPLEFGTLAIPTMGSCLYTLGPDGARSGTSGTCQFLEGDVLPADFTLSCSANTLVQFQLFYSDDAPSGSSFAASPAPMAIDGAKPGAAYQVSACDIDGLSNVKAGGQIELTPDAPHEFSGPVGSIRLEVAYN